MRGTHGRVTGRRRARLLGRCVLMACGMCLMMLFTAGRAAAVACGSAETAGTACTLTGTAGVTAGALNLTSPSALAWATTLTGLDLQLADTTTAHQSYLVDDATGSGLGWHVTVSATTFTNGSATLANSGTFSTNGSTSSETATTAPTAACSSGATCVLPTDVTTYPAAITTATSSPTAVDIYDTSASSGMGSITIGVGADPVGWWLNMPAKGLAGSYTSTVTLEVISGP